MIAQHVALRHPSRVRGLVLLATTAGFLLGALPEATALRPAALASARRSARREEPHASPPPRVEVGSGPRRSSATGRTRCATTPRRRGTFAAHLFAASTHLVTRRLRSAFAARRSWSPARTTRSSRSATPQVLAREIPNAELEVVADTGHAVFADDRDLVRRMVVRLEKSIEKGLEATGAPSAHRPFALARAPSLSTLDIVPGTQVIADRFELEQLVGSGGMGEVFRARDRLTGGAVAVKVLHASSRDTERFRREAQLLAEVSHPRIVKYVAHGIAEGSRPYIAMEWLEGEDLGERLSRSGLTLHETLALARRVAEGLAVLHERGIVHRDIKPSNLFLPGGKFDQVKLLDLGVARLLHASRPSTRSGVMVGTPGYMAPEQARGNKEIDARADVFSLGCVIYECLAGTPVFAGDNIAALLAKILLETPMTLRDAGFDVPPALDDLVTRMLSKHVTARPTNGAALLRELDQFKAVKDSPAQRASAPAMRALTGSERRLVSVVMASLPPDRRPSDESLEESGRRARSRRWPRRSIRARIVASFGAEARDARRRLDRRHARGQGRGERSGRARRALRARAALASHRRARRARDRASPP